ncbi:MAG: hypothetical protein NT169_12805 [Chloroflexi bacterium]|nr:hypothetical protein [Chloroflexota bacterium]
MNKRSPYSRTEIFFIIAVALAGAVLCAVGMAWYLDRDNQWFRIVSPPNKTATEIVALDRGLNAFVRTQQGNLYLCGGRTWRDACRKVSPDELPVNKIPLQWLTCGSATFPQLPAAPGAVVASIEVGRCDGVATYSKLVILNDGTLWQWRRTFTWANQFAAGTCVILGLGIGIALGLFLVKMRRYLRKT